MGSNCLYSSVSISLVIVSYLLLFLGPLHATIVKSQLPPALYVFGDSLSDSGNNNFLQTQIKSNYSPYGVDFPGGRATGRFTNGRNVVDYIAKWLRLPYAPAYLSLSDKDRAKITTGINYASGGAGILPESSKATGDILALNEQVNYFRNTATNDLPKSFRSPTELSCHLSKSLFFVSIGSNDYINNYLQPTVYNSSRIYTPQQFGELLLAELQEHLKTLYSLGARKFVVFEIGPLGCLPGVLSSANPKPNTPCVETVNNLVNIFNTGLPSTIETLKSSLEGSTFIRGLIYQNTYDTSQDPPKFGYTGGQSPCCILQGNGLCLPNQVPCESRKKYLYWDAYHPTQEQGRRFATDCFFRSSTCVPINIKQLATN